jgi:HK97 family phage prohead protease
VTLTVSTVERRRLGLTDAGAEVHTARDDDQGVPRFRGYAAKFNTRAAIGNPLTWGFYEQIAAGAFTDTLGRDDQRMLIDHDPYYVVSRVSAGTLHLAQDGAGLLTDSALDPALSYVGDLMANLRNGNISGMSFGFYVEDDTWATEDVETSDGHTAEVEVRTINRVRLLEVSAVTFPAYEDTDAGVRSVASALAHRGDRRAVEARAEHRPNCATCST